MAVAFVVQKQHQKARNFLKRISKAPWNMEVRWYIILLHKVALSIFFS